MVRTIAIWAFGLLASAMVGGLTASYFFPYQPGYDPFPFFLGILAGICAFSCLRLWTALDIELSAGTRRPTGCRVIGPGVEP